MNFIKKIVDHREDESVHLQFQKFSRGEFKNRAVLKVKKTKNKYSINSTGEFINEFVRMMAEKLGSEKTKMTGAVIATSDFKLKGTIDIPPHGENTLENITMTIKLMSLAKIVPELLPLAMQLLTTFKAADRKTIINAVMAKLMLIAADFQVNVIGEANGIEFVYNGKLV